MDLVPCDANARQRLADSLFEVNDAGLVNKKTADYVARTFPDILLDIARLLTEQATKGARELTDPGEKIKSQLKPYLMFNLLLGKCPQITGLMYNYFEKSSFQPLPANLFQWNREENRIGYLYPGFTDEVVKEILTSYFKYLSFNPKWFSAVWNWSELGRFITMHVNEDIRYLSACCLSVITQPTRQQHISFMREIVGIDQYQSLIDLQIKHRHIFDNTYKPCLETKKEMAEQYAKAIGFSPSGYSYCSESIAKVANILLLKRDLNLDPESSSELLSRCEKTINNFVPVVTLNDSISKIAYSISISKPCLMRGPCGSGKTAIIDYIAAHTNRVDPPDYVKVQIGDQIDSKLLIGSYVCTEIPGQFEWRPGPLTRAMAYGSWIVFEDIDSAPAEMAQVIHSVLENGNLSCVSCCPIKLDSPHPDFRIFFTQRSRASQASELLNLGYGFVERLCDIVDLPQLTDNDLIEIVDKKYKFGQLTQTILKLFKASQEGVEDNDCNRSSRLITLRDLFKLCDRIASQNTQSHSGKITSKEFESIFIDATDCFLSAMSRSGGFQTKAEELGQIINIPCNEVQRLVMQRTPDIREESGSFQIGRAKLICCISESDKVLRSRSTLAYTKQSLQLLESVALCIKQREPVLLVGETGVGKTSIVQHLANLAMTDLTVINLSQQSDSSDLLGGYKPVEIREIMLPLNQDFDNLFRQTFDSDKNATFLHHVSNCFASAKKNHQWNVYLKLICKLSTKALNYKLSKSTLDSWNELHDRARRLSKRIMAEKDSPMALKFSEGSLLQAVKNGHWILLDEINLAEPDVLQCLLLILDSLTKSKIHMYNANDNDGIIKIHPNFRIFACMNPSTDIGKRDLAIGTRGRFTEFFVDDITERQDLRLIVESYVKTCLTSVQIENVVNFYREVRARAEVLSDISGNLPVFSLRTLCRALQICANNVCRNMEKSLYESLKITFLQQLNETSITYVLKLTEQVVFDKKDTSYLDSIPVQMPTDDHQYIEVGGFWIQKSNDKPFVDEKYIITETISRNLRSLSRIISLSQRRLPILVQGNTSVGKTSLITYLAKLTGNKCYRINNHEHTDLQEYVGRYVLKENGEMVFQEGLLVRAMKKGYWIILDELNLAPSELLEALNRVLDENRELFIPETRETIKAHSKFMIFATQNPPEEYAGRKLLSRAFRNRFIELHFDEIPGDELEFILHKRCEMPPSYAKKIVAVMKELQMYRRESGCFNGKNSFMTMRDLFRWGHRYEVSKHQIPDEQFFDWESHIASEGLILLEGRARTSSEAETIKSILEKVFRCKLDYEIVYKETFKSSNLPPNFTRLHFTREFKKLYIQLSHALNYREPVLLCGPTGCGKTTACQLFAACENRELITYNCHMNTESSDFVGGVRPMRQQDDSDQGSKQIFPWVNGPLVEAMKVGAMFLMDEISLADDAVLERINSVLEPTRSITITEKTGEEIFANDAFRLVATMNPGGDYGKKELSPALRNRFTEIYCHNTKDLGQIIKIIEGYMTRPMLKPAIAPKLLYVMHSFLGEYYQDREAISLRDVISWIQFIINTIEVPQPRPLSIQEAILNGVSLVFFDQFGTCGHRSTTLNADHELKARLKNKLSNLVDEKFGAEPVYIERLPTCVEINNDIVVFKKFVLKKGNMPIYDDTHKEFVLDAPMVRNNLMKIVRAMMLNKPILLEGNPGAGKTSIVSALAKLTGHQLIRINLSEQTDISDLFGSDLPSTSDTDDGAPSFSWRDGPLLQAIKKSQWVLLDEMNLASQSVLEGLNACFDHRSEIYIPELNKRVKVDRSTTRIFACQNPYNQGAARKGLPQSFLNRFTSIYIESHTPQDLFLVIKNLYPNLNDDLITKMVEFNSEISDTYSFAGFEFNLRDILYWCDLMTRYVRGDKFKEMNLYQPERFVQFAYLDRMRISVHRTEMAEIFERIFGVAVYEPPYRDIRLGEHSFILTRALLPRKTRPPPQLPELCILKYQMPYIESIAKAIEYNKMPIVVGEFGVGKRSMIRILAGLTGNTLNIIGANREMDTGELLGTFEQKSFQREIVELVEEAKSCVISLINSISQKQFASTWSQFFNHIWCTLYATSIRDLRLSKSEMMDAYRFQLNQMRELIDKIQPLSSQNTEKSCSALLQKINRLVNKSLFYSESMYSSGSFEWLDSILIKSIREGSWLMIENANLMNPATLDRLNSLVEPKGALSLNEKGSSNLDEIETLVPHPDFRLILTTNPEHGELSRAMRNRGVEIFVQPKFYFEDYLMLLNQNGFEPEEKKACMAYCIMQTSHDAHKRITGEEPGEDGSLLAYFGLNYIPTLTHQVRRGKKIDKILVDLLLSYYTQRGFADECSDETLNQYIYDQLNVYRKTYEVNLVDDRYKWRHLRHDLVSLTGGDAITAMLDRDNRIFFDDISIDLLKPDEMIENLDIVNTCINVKIFLELSTHGDFEYRKGFIRETFGNLDKMMNTVNNHVDLLHSEYIPLINSLMPRSDLAPVSEMHVDSRNAPDIHYYLLGLDYTEAMKREWFQNRWLLSLHRIMLRMIVEIAEVRSMETPDNVSLWSLSEQVRSGALLKEDLIRPTAEIVSDLFDLLNGILRVVSNRSFSNEVVARMLPRFSWLSYFICKLKKGHNRNELIGICNQLPMLWALTYQKIIVPLIKDCELADLVYKNKKFSNRIQHICDFLDMIITKPGHIEKAYYKKILNMFTTTTKQCETINREVDKFFVTMIGRYTTRSQSLSLSQSNPSEDTLAASYSIWSNSSYMLAFYDIQEKILQMDLADSGYEISEWIDKGKLYLESTTILSEKRMEYESHESWLKDDKSRYKSKCLNVHRRMNALDQFAPIWQLNFIHLRLAKIMPNISNPSELSNQLMNSLRSINGIIMSPKYYSNMIRHLHNLKIRKESQDNNASMDMIKILREDVDMYTAFLSNHLIENVILDHQVVGWTKLRVTTSDVPSMAPLIPEYAPLISLVSGYCLDIAHLKLNSYLSSSAQLDSMLIYLWRHYVSIKLDLDKNIQDIELARNLIHMRSKLDLRDELVGAYECVGSNNCLCIDEYIRKRLPNYERLIDTIKSKLIVEEAETTIKSVKLIYFGYFNYLEYAPIFTLDPSLRSREKLEVYRSELAHVKLDLHFRNTLFYWKTGENLQLNEIDSEGAALYPFSTRLLVDRRVKLEKSINRLRREHTNRPKSDDGSLYYELRREVEVNINRYSNNIHTLINDLNQYISCAKKDAKATKFTTLITKSRMIIKSLEKTISRFKSDYILYTDLITNFLVGMSFVLQGLRCLYSSLEQKMQIHAFGFDCSTQKYLSDIINVYSFTNFDQGNLESVNNKLEFLPKISRICPPEEASKIRSSILKSVLIQLNYHITITPSDIEKCIPIVRRIADKFHAAWLEHKRLIEQASKEKEELYRYTTSRTTLGTEVSYEHEQEFRDICKKFPTYDHVYQTHFSFEPTSADQENLKTEEKISNLYRSVDLSVCIEICKAHYKFIKEASRNLLGQVSSSNADNMPAIDLSQLIKLESEVLYTIVRHAMPTLDRSFDSQSVECHLLQTNQLIKTLRQTETNKSYLGPLKSSIEILDDDIFDIYHSANAHEALKFQEFITSIDTKVRTIGNIFKDYETHPILLDIVRLITRISSFLITDPLMKFVTGSHTLLEKIEEWNRQSIPKEAKMIDESFELVELIKSWRQMEIESWRSSLHGVKRRYIDARLCDLWFDLYAAFNNPIKLAEKLYQEKTGAEFTGWTKENENLLYVLFMVFMKDFLEESTLGDYQIRLDLVFSFAIQTRFANLHEQNQRNRGSTPGADAKDGDTKDIQVDYEKLNTFVYNTHRQYHGLLEHLKVVVEKEEQLLTKELHNEIRIVAWQGRNLWEIKNNFRISHRKLNKVMNKYLEVLRRPLPSLNPTNNLSDQNSADPETNKNVDSEKVSMTLACIPLLIQNVDPPKDGATGFEPLKKAGKIVSKFKNLFNSIYEPMTSKLYNNLFIIEDANESYSQMIQNFHSHKVQDIVLNSKDSKETIASKHKLCRQMYNSKKYAMQNVFKKLQEIGASYQRGLINQPLLDDHVLSLEPLRGMIQNQSRLVLKAAKELVEDDIIIDCNEQYRKLIASNWYLLAQPNGEELTSEQFSRVRGYALDIVLDIIKHNRNAASMYRYLMDIQAATTRLTQLRGKSESKDITIYNFTKVHGAVKQFNELVGRAYLAILKLEEFAEVYKTVEQLESTASIDQTQQPNECSVLKELISDVSEDSSMMTDKQYNHFKSNLPAARKSITEVSSNLRDMLHHEVCNHLYSHDDLNQLDQLFDQFINAFGAIVPDTEDNSLDSVGNEVVHTLANTQSDTVLGSIRVLLDEARNVLRPKIKRMIIKAGAEENSIKLDNHPNLVRLNTRLRKLIRQVMLAIQGIYRNEMSEEERKNSSQFLGESEKRKLKPFNYIDSDKIKRLLRLEQVAKYTSDCFCTLNREQTSTDIQPIVFGLTPILFIYTQNIACFLNIILTSLHLKLRAANRLIPFFTDLVTNGFGLPYKATEDNSDGQEMKGKMSEDNTGFGEGKGDTDVSKKLEFESQLDELKKNGDDNEDKEKGEDDFIEAHDDGVEVSDDIDAKAQGPENDDSRTGNEGDEKDQSDDDENYDELDKELDRVDDDEGKLDEQLWDDKDEPLDEDDESDLRETDLSSATNKEEAKLEAKDEQVAESKNDLESKFETEEGNKDEPMSSEDQREGEVAEEKEENVEESSINEAPKNLDKDQTAANDEGLDLEEEAAQANKQSLAPETEDASTNDKTETEDSMDMSISDENLIVDEDSNKEEEKKKGDEDKSEGEISDDDQPDFDEPELKPDEPKLSQNMIDDDEIDNQLECAQNPMLDEKLENIIEQTIRNLPANAQNNDQNSRQELKGKKCGQHTVYEIFSEEPNDPLDIDEPESNNDNEKLPSPDNQQQLEQQGQAKGFSSMRNLDDNSIELEDISDDSADEMIDDKQQPDDDSVATDRPPKRTFADRDPEDASGIKRQKILEANQGKDVDVEEKPEVEEKKQRDNTTTSSQVRHIDKDTSTAIEVIDLVSSESEDEEKQSPFLKNIELSSTENPEMVDDSAELMEQIDKELDKKQSDDFNSVDMDRLTNLWLDCTRRTGHLVHELCQRLQIVLQPTKMSKYKGDYKSGKRLNMRKIISYIASHYRKDKIWLRRTKPSKRTYNICLAVDNSSSMSENNCRQMTYQSLALLAKSLSLIEAGSLSVVSFGEQVKCIHEFGQPYMDAIGAQWLRELRFNESQTYYKLLLKHSCESFTKQAQATRSQLDTQGAISQLLIIISDGRSVSSEEEEIKGYLKQLKSLGVLTLFVLIDDMKMNGGKSVVDTKRCLGIGANISIVNYMELFPFPFYVILRQLETMPSILGDSLRQWFELVSGASGSN